MSPPTSINQPDARAEGVIAQVVALLADFREFARQVLHAAGLSDSDETCRT